MTKQAKRPRSAPEPTKAARCPHGLMSLTGGFTFCQLEAGHAGPHRKGRKVWR